MMCGATGRRAGLLLGLLLLTPVAAAQPFLPDDPLWVDPDRVGVEAPYAVPEAVRFEAVRQFVWPPGEEGGRAVNINTLGEVPNSSWYVNRHYRRPMTLDALRRGPNSDGAPSVTGDWHVYEIDQEGAVVRLRIRDERDRHFVLQFDAPNHPGLATQTGVVVHRLLYALGYRVPEAYLVHFPGAQLHPDEGISGGDLRSVLLQVPRGPGDRLQALAVRQVEGKDLGPFRFYGTRPDDANDIFPHEARRELRGLRVVAAWLGLDHVGPTTTRDVYVERGGEQFVLHYLHGFPWGLGSGPDGPKVRWAGHEHVVNGTGLMARMLSLGLVGAPWTSIDDPRQEAVGHFAPTPFDPAAWRPRVPNPAFVRMDEEDAFWAAKQVANLGDDVLRAVVEVAGYTDEAATYLVQALAHRRDAIAEAYLGLGGGLDRFAVHDGRLTLVDLWAQRGLAQPGRAVHVVWRRYDNAADRGRTVLSDEVVSLDSVGLPPGRPPYLQAWLHVPGQGVTTVYLRREGDDYTVVGVRRSPDVPLWLEQRLSATARATGRQRPAGR